MSHLALDCFSFLLLQANLCSPFDHMDEESLWPLQNRSLQALSGWELCVYSLSCQSMPSGCLWRSRLRTGIEILGQLQWCWCMPLFLHHCSERTQSPETRWRWYNRSISVTKHQKAILCKAWSLLCWAKTLTATTWWITSFGIFQHQIRTQYPGVREITDNNQLSFTTSSI